MPKIVDHEKRKEQIAEATWNVIRKEGLRGVSVRRIAEELGMSLGSLRHYFDAQSELISYSMELITVRVHQRIQKLPFTDDPRHNIELVIQQIIPLDDERTLEAEVWLSYAGEAIYDPNTRHIMQRVHQELYNGIYRMMDLLHSNGQLKKGVHIEQASKRLHALVDGLVLHYTISPEHFSREEIMEIIMHHLDELTLP